MQYCLIFCCRSDDPRLNFRLFQHRILSRDLSRFLTILFAQFF
jgi:hypothetical protein